MMMKKLLLALGIFSILSCTSTQSLSQQTVSSPPVYAVKTISIALDRIDQRQLPLDTVFRHRDTGAGVTVYIFDGGINPNYFDIAGRVTAGINTSGDTTALCNNHGTAVASAIGGSFTGVAPEAALVDVKVMNCKQLVRGSLRAMTDAVTWVIADHLLRHTNAVVNWSLIIDTVGVSTPLTAEVHSLLERLVTAGIPVVLAGGNFDVDACKVWPEKMPGTLIVGGVDETFQHREPTMAWGSCLDVYAPSSQIVVLSMYSDSTRSQQTVESWSGTSFATAYTTGAVALFLEEHPYANPRDAELYIKKNSTKNVIADSHATDAGLLYVGIDPL